MSQSLVVLAVLFTNTLAFAHEFKSKDICSVTTKDICAHIGYDKKPAPNEKFVFTFDIVNKVKAKDVKNVEITAFVTDAKGQKESYATTWKIRPDGHHWDAEMKEAPKGVISGVTMKYDYNKNKEEITIDLK